MSAILTTADIDHIIDLIRKIEKLLMKNDVLITQEQKEAQLKAINYAHRQPHYGSRAPWEQNLKEERERAKNKYRKTDIPQLQKELDTFLAPKWEHLLPHSDLTEYPEQLKKEVRIKLLTERCLDITTESIRTFTDKIVRDFECIKAKIEYQTKQPAKTGQNAEGSVLMITAGTSKENWEAIRNEYGISKMDFGKKINFVSDKFKREIIFRDTEHAFVLASQGFSKPALILAGGVIEELLRLYLKRKRIKPERNTFFGYIEACKEKILLKYGVSRLGDSLRDFRNYVHLAKERTKSDTILKTTAKGAVSSIFTIANDFQ